MSASDNPNSLFKRIYRVLWSRWAAEDQPLGEPRFQLKLFTKDVAIFVLFPISMILTYKVIEASFTKPSKKSNTAQVRKAQPLSEGGKSQIIEFQSNGSGTGFSGVGKRSPGTLVKVRLLNVVETYSDAPVHAQIVDEGLGKSLMGGTLIGDATPDEMFDRIKITFRFVRDPRKSSVAIPISARGLMLDGTLGLEARKKEGFLARSAIGSANESARDAQSGNTDGDFKQILFRALTAGLVKEFGSESEVARNRARVLSLPPSSVFFAELTDFFPRGAK